MILRTEIKCLLHCFKNSTNCERYKKLFYEQDNSDFFFSLCKLFQLWVLSKHGSKGMGFGNTQMLVSFHTQAHKLSNMNAVKLSLAHCKSKSKFFGYRQRSVFIWSNIYIFLQAMKGICQICFYLELASRGKSKWQSRPK